MSISKHDAKISSHFVIDYVESLISVGISTS